MSDVERAAPQATEEAKEGVSSTGRGYREHTVPRGPHHLYARDYLGSEPAIVLLHGFPDDLHLYDRLVPELTQRRVVVFDFLGWGRSDKPTGYAYTAGNQTGDLEAVLGHLQLDPVVLVAHDASGPPTIDWSLDHAGQVSGLVLLNTYYCRMPGSAVRSALCSAPPIPT
jgi:haloalkane dehalogenase